MALGRNGDKGRGRFSRVAETGAGSICAIRSIRRGREREQGGAFVTGLAFTFQVSVRTLRSEAAAFTLSEYVITSV